MTSPGLKIIMTGLLFLSACSSAHALASLISDEPSFETTGSIFRAVMSEPDMICQKFREACERDFQHPDKLVIKFGKTPAHRLMGGYFSTLSLRAEGGGVDSVKLKSFRMECRGVHFDLKALLTKGKLDVRLVDSMDMSVSVREEAFNSLFNTHSGKMDVQNPVIKMHEDEISFSGTVKAFLFKSRISARGPLELTPDGKVNFNLKRLKVSGVRLPGFVVRKISTGINPIADFNKFKFWKCWNMNLKSVTVKPGQLTLSSFDYNDVCNEPRFAETFLETVVLSELKKG